MSEVEGESGMGARPKIMTEIDDEYWMIKFPAQIDGADAGVMEYDYFLCAKACGIPMSDSRLFPLPFARGISVRNSLTVIRIPRGNSRESMF